MGNIYGLVTNQDGSWRLRTNEETDLPVKHVDMARFITAQRIRWIGRIVRMDRGQ
jgi:hypothetical protein